MEVQNLLYGLHCAGFGLTLALSGLLYRKLRRLEHRLDQPQQTDIAAPVSPAEQPSAFPQQLVLAELRKNLRQSPAGGTTPDKYRYVVSLVKNGLEAEQIAEVLQLGRGEAEQLVSLALLSERKAPSPIDVVRPREDCSGRAAFARLKERAA